VPNNPPETQVLRDSLTREVTNDAYVISQQIFKGQEADVSRVTNEQIDERYSRAFQENDRQYLMAEAGRDPVQFLASMERLGVTMPPDKQVDQQAPLPRAARANVPLPPQPDHANAPTYDTPQDIPPPAAVPPTPAPPPVLASPISPPSVTPGTVPNVTTNIPPS
jgi:hypothetical protein